MGLTGRAAARLGASAAAAAAAVEAPGPRPFAGAASWPCSRHGSEGLRTGLSALILDVDSRDDGRLAERRRIAVF